MRPTWAADTARRIGLSGQIDFTTTRCGMTLHVPCSHGDGHLVDFVVRPGLAPNGVAKAMLAKGWTVGSKIKCPEHSRKEKPADGVKRAPKPMRAFFDSLTDEQAREIKASGGKKTWAGLTLEERRAKMNAINPYIKKGKDPMATSPNPPAMSPDAKKAHRLVMGALEDFYDEAKKRYRPGHTDQSIADEVGVAPAAVAKVREEFFGLSFSKHRLNWRCSPRIWRTAQ